MPCAANEALIGNTCSACAPGSIPQGSVCVSCGANEISVGNQCVACPLGQGPNRTTNLCEDCPPDGIIDWAGLADPACHSETVVEVSAPGDICPDEFWVEAVNLNGTSPGGRNSDFEIEGDLATDIADQALCQDTDVFVTVAERQGTAFANIGQVSSLNPGVCTPNPICPNGRCIHNAIIILPFSQVAAGRTTVRVRALAQNSTSSLPASITLSTGNCDIPPVE